MQYEYQNPADNVALAIYRDENAAQQALNASPIRFALERVADKEPDYAINGEDEEDYSSEMSQDPSKQAIDEMLRPPQLANRTLTSPTEVSSFPKPPQSTMPFEPVTSPNANTRKVSKWFQVTVDRSRVVHQDYVERQPFWKQYSPMKSMAQKDLLRKVPHVGLSDVSKRPPHAYRTPTKVLELMNEYVEHKMPTLKGMAENDAVESAYRQRKGL